MTGRTIENASPFMSADSLWRAFLEDDQGSIDAVGDYSTAAKEFSVSPSTGGTFICCRIDMAMAFNAKFDVLQYGPIANGLTTGLRLMFQENESTKRALDGNIPIMNNFDWAMLATGGGALQPDESVSKNDEGFYGVGLDLTRIAAPVALAYGDKIVLEVNDDLRGGDPTPTMLRHRFLASGDKTNVMP